LSEKQEYAVGDVLFVLDDESQRIIPIQVFSFTSKQTLQGTVKSYEIVSPSRVDVPVDLARVKGQVYVSLEELRHDMLRNAQTAIDSMVARAHRVAEQIFGPQKFVTDDPDVQLIPDAETQEASAPASQATVTLPDGTVARVSLPNEISPPTLGVQEEHAVG